MSTRFNVWNQKVAAPKNIVGPQATAPKPTTSASPEPSAEPPLEAGSWTKSPTTPMPERFMYDQRRDPNAMQRLSKTKTRRHAISISVSTEEEDILRAAAYNAGLNFSEWARTHLFAAAGKKIPSRSRKAEIPG